jgi:acyl-CoA synthetase (NDP forming)
VLPSEGSVRNPIDMLGSATDATYEQVLPLVLADPGIDAAIVIFVLTIVAETPKVCEAIRRVQESATKPVIPVVMSAEGGMTGGFSYPESAARALALVAQRAQWLARPAGVVPELDGIDEGAARVIVDAALSGIDDAWLDAGQTRALLQAYGLPVVPERTVATPVEAAEAAVELGLPAVVKTAEAGVHKTESGGVALDLRTADEVRAAAERIGGPVLVQPFLKGGTELLAGIVQDPTFGPLVAFGPGGTLAELIGAARFALAPITDVDAEIAMTTGKAARLIAGWRGAPPADQEALKDLLHRLSRLSVDFPELAELDLNPVIAGPDGCVAVDARIRLRRPEPAVSPKTW